MIDTKKVSWTLTYHIVPAQVLVGHDFTHDILPQVNGRALLKSDPWHVHLDNEVLFVVVQPHLHQIRAATSELLSRR